MSLYPEPNHTYLVSSGHGVFKMRVTEVDDDQVAKGVVVNMGHRSATIQNNVVCLGRDISVRLCNATFRKA